MKEEIAARLREARNAAIGSSATSAAEQLGMSYQTYVAHENGNRSFDAEAAVKYARRYKVSLDWLLTGHGKGPGGAQVEPSIKDDTEILSMLARIEGLSENDIDLAYGVIRNARAARRAEPEPSASRDQRQPANRRREEEPSR